MNAPAPAALVRSFQQRFDRAPQAAARAPGRVNLIGEHTDYNGGLVLPCALELETVVVLAARDDGCVRLHSIPGGAGEPRFADVAWTAHPGKRLGSWGDYVAGVVWALAEAGAEVPGFDLALSSDVPSGAGLSSSAALQVAVVTALDALLGLGLDARARAALAQRSENGFVGVRCGILDPWASALCEPGAALRIDCATQSARSVPLPVSEIAILLTDSGVRRELADGAYNLRVEECARALAEARRAGIASAQASSLSELDVDDLGALGSALESTLESQLLRRVRHVLTENARVDAFEAALRVGSLARAGELLCESQRSLRDDYEVSIPELDVLCELGEAQPGVHGSRLTGAGFGGCVLHLAAATQAEAALEGICSGFERRFARRPRSWVLRSGRGASALDVPG